MNIVDTLPDAAGLATALAIGLLIGLERGWSSRDLSEGSRVAGLRTFALTGLLGGLLASLHNEFGSLPLLCGLIGISLLLVVSYRKAVDITGSLSITTAVALLLTFVIGAIAARGAIELALTAGIVVTLLLALKPTLHGWLRLIEYRELTAALQLLVLSVVILPNLPDAGYGPYEALNPYRLWWAIVLIASLSLAGHLAMRLSGPQRGILWTGLLGGMASSTAATLALARYAKQQPALMGAACAGILAASGVMFLRILILIGTLGPGLLKTFGLPLLITGLALLALAIWQRRRSDGQGSSHDHVDAMAPFDLGTAFGFGAFLALMAVLVPAAREWLGSGGLYLLATLSGIADVDAIVIALTRLQATAALSTTSASVAIGLATLANMTSKGVITWVTAGQSSGRRVTAGYAAAMALGAMTLLIML